MFLTPSPSCVKLCYGFPTLYRGRGGILNTLFKIPIIICHWLSKIYKKKRKMRFYACWFRKPKCALMSWLCYRTFCHEHNDSKRCQSGAQNAATMFLSCYYLALEGKRLLQALNDNYCSLVTLLCIYFCYFMVFNHVQPVLNNFFSKSHVSLERSSLDEAKIKHQNIEKVEI